MAPPGAGPVGNLRDWEPLQSLAEEFRYNAGIVGKVSQLEQRGYGGWRRVRGDGNCFYRAVGFGLLELIVTTDSPRRADWAAALLQKLAALRLQDAGERAAHAALLACVRGLFAAVGLLRQGQREPRDLLVDSAAEDLLRVMSNPDRSEDLALVRALRVLVAQYITEHAHDDSLNGGISFQLIAESLGYAGAEGFCSAVVLASGVEAEDMILPAVPGALGVGLCVALLHRSSGSDLIFCNYGLDAEDESARPVVHLQLRPGHYDLLYPAAWMPASSSGAFAQPPPAQQEKARSTWEPPARGATLPHPRGHNGRGEGRPSPSQRSGSWTLPATSASLPVAGGAPSASQVSLGPPATCSDLRSPVMSAAPRPPATSIELRPLTASAELRPPATSAELRPPATELRRPAASSSLRPPATSAELRPAAASSALRPPATSAELRPPATPAAPRREALPAAPREAAAQPYPAPRGREAAPPVPPLPVRRTAVDLAGLSGRAPGGPPLPARGAPADPAALAKPLPQRRLQERPSVGSSGGAPAAPPPRLADASRPAAPGDERVARALADAIQGRQGRALADAI
ncbi:unnamed protein product [Prorocentrum cordatum]|uniref:ubiquitinyl hydrolase 1 n=1 Tax=Prorocentrum cordatum TaxID=2364126 RepID=A0ABN9WRN3_9DINO|nr:unnamed protein product [Polarella glacialis]